MNVFLHSLLVIKQMNYFTVTEARDVLIREHAEFTDQGEASKFIYRQLYRNIAKGFLKREDFFNTGTKKTIYSKTEKFLASEIIPISRAIKKKEINIRKALGKFSETVNYKVELKKELISYEINLNTIIEEAKEYKRIAKRFPHLQSKLIQHQSQAKDKTIELQGKVKALQNLLG